MIWSLSIYLVKPCFPKVFVVYFNQRVGAAHPNLGRNSLFQHSLQTKTENRKKKPKIEARFRKNDFLSSKPKVGLVFFDPLTVNVC